MSSISSKNFCDICNKGKGTFKCEGCLKIYCPKHSIEHRNNLSKQLEDIELAHDLAFKIFSQQIQNIRQHSLMQFVDQWEHQSIQNIRQLADQIRTNLIQDIDEHNQFMKNKLQDLSEQLRQARDDNDFLEDDLQKWTQLLEQLKTDIQHPVNIKIENDSIPIVHKICIHRQIHTDLSRQENEQFFLKDDSEISIDYLPNDDHQHDNNTIHSQIESIQELDQR